jgi:MSHA biogenesis protein MshJ
MNDTQASINPYLQKYKELSQREKALALAMTAALIYMLFSWMVFAPLNEQKQVLAQETGSLQEGINELAQTMAVYSANLTKDPDQIQKNKIKALQVQLNDLDKALSDSSVGLVRAEQLPVLLQDVLTNRGKLKLVSLKTLPVEQIDITASPNPEKQGLIDEPATEALGVYKHGVEIVFVGKYFDSQDYLSSLENLSWRFYWDNLTYQVDAHPKGNITLQVYTLSTAMGAFGA